MLCSLLQRRRLWGSLTIAVLLLGSGFAAKAQASAAACEELSRSPAPGAQSMTASLVAAGPAPSFPGMPPQGTVPEHCRVIAVMQPVPDSRIQVEIWLPDPSAWNGKLLGTGNGGYSSMIYAPQLAEAVRHGYAVAGSDTGHTGDSLTFGVGHPEKIRDWAYRSTHVMAETLRAVSAAYYGRSAKRAYFDGCSTGGQQALSEAQRYPDDFDGIVAGDPGYDRIALNGMFLWSWLVTHPEHGAAFPADKLLLLAHAVMQACGGRDGYAQDVIADPRECHPDLERLRCSGADGANCLTEAEIHEAEELYAGPHDATTGASLYPGWPAGSETGWGAYFVGKPEPARLAFWRLWIFDDPNWDPRSFHFVRDSDAARTKLPYVDATDSDLRAFRRQGGKLLMYHGWADPVVPPEDSIDYYEAVEKNLGTSPADFMRLFMVPGMHHCFGGPGATIFDPLAALDAWVTSGVAPERIVAEHRTNGQVDRTRPLCPYPQRAMWSGHGNQADASSFVCVAPSGRH